MIRTNDDRRARIKEMLESGLSGWAIHRTLGISQQTVSYYRRVLGYPAKKPIHVHSSEVVAKTSDIVATTSHIVAKVKSPAPKARFNPVLCSACQVNRAGSTPGKGSLCDSCIADMVLRPAPGYKPAIRPVDVQPLNPEVESIDEVLASLRPTGKAVACFDEQGNPLPGFDADGGDLPGWKDGVQNPN